MFLYNFKLAIASLKRNVVYSSLSIAGFTIGLAVCVMIAMHIYNQLTYDMCFDNHERIYRVVDKKNNTSNIDYNLQAYLNDNFPDVKVSCAIQLFDESFKIKTKTKFVRFNGLASTNNEFFKVFSLNVLLKTGDEPFVDENSVVITKSVATALFGDSNPLGEMVTVDDDYRGVVSAVIEDLPKTSSLQSNVFISSANIDWRFYQTWYNRDSYVYQYAQFVLFKESTDVEAFTEKLNGVIPSVFPAIGEIWLQKIARVYLSKPTESSVNRHGSVGMLYLFIALGLIVMVISTINYLNFKILLKVSSLKEIGVRRIVGAKNKDILLHSLMEVGVYLIISIALAVLLVAQLTPYANSMLNVNLSLQSVTNPVLAATILFLLIPVVFVSVIVPFLFIPHKSITAFLSKGGSVSNRLPLRNVLTIVQFAVTILLFAVVIVISKQINFVKTTDLGFEKEQLVGITLPYGFNQSVAFKQRLEQTSIHSGVSSCRGTPGFINHTFTNPIENNPFSVEIIYVDYDFINTMGIDLIMGREFIDGEKGRRCIVNQEFINRAQWDSYENQFLWKNMNGGFEVVGVVKDFHTASLYTKVEPVCLMLANCTDLKQKFSVDMNTLFNVNIRLTPGDISSKMAQLQNIWSEFIPDEPLDYFFFDSHFDSLYREEERLGKSLRSVSLIAILLTCFGLLGQIMHISLTRTKEIGIRKVNGAKIWQVMLMLNLDFVKWVAIAFVIATPIAYYAMDKWLQNFAYRTQLSWWVFALAGLLALAIALLTVSWQSWKAARRNPVEALRYE
jgi:putative ABC transport system permease protein